MHFIADRNKHFIFDLKDNRLATLSAEKSGKKTNWTNINELAIPDDTPVKVWLKDMKFPVLSTKQIRSGGPVQERRRPHDWGTIFGV